MRWFLFLVAGCSVAAEERGEGDQGLVLHVEEVDCGGTVDLGEEGALWAAYECSQGCFAVGPYDGLASQLGSEVVVSCGSAASTHAEVRWVIP